MLVYTHNMHSGSSANNTLHLWMHKQWFMESCLSVSQFHFLVCAIPVTHSLQGDVLKQTCPMDIRVCEVEGTFEAGVGMWQGD